LLENAFSDLPKILAVKNVAAVKFPKTSEKVKAPARRTPRFPLKLST